MKYILISMLIFSGCAKNVLSIENIQSVKVTRQPISGNPKIKSFALDAELVEVLTKINNSKPSPLKFQPNYQIDITYNDRSEVVAFINHTSIKIEGKTFLCNEKIEQLLENYFTSKASSPFPQ